MKIKEKNQNKKTGKIYIPEAHLPKNQTKKEANQKQPQAQRQNQSRQKSRRKNKAIMDAINASN